MSMSLSLRVSGARWNEGVVDTRVQVKRDMRTIGRQVATAVRIININMHKPIQLASAHKQVTFKRPV